MMKSFGVSNRSTQELSHTMGADTKLIDSAAQSIKPTMTPSGEKPSESNPFNLDGLKGLTPPSLHAAKSAQGVMKMADENPVLFEAVTMAASVAIPPAAPAIQAGKRAVQAANTADNMVMDGKLKGGAEGRGEQVAQQARPMLESDASFQEINQEWSQQKSVSISERVSQTVGSLFGRKDDKKMRNTMG